MKKSIFNSMVAMTSPPPPSSKKSRKTLIALIAIILLVAVVVGVYLATQGIGTNPSVTPTPTPSSGATSTPTPSSGATSTPTPSSGATSTPTPSSGTSPTPTSSGTGANVAGASSLQFTTSITNSAGASQGSYTYYAKNAGTPNMMIRIEMTDPSSGSNIVYIINGALQQAWMQIGGQWTDLSSTFTSELSNWDTTFKGYQNNLADWSGVGDWTYTSPTGETIRISNVSVNPSLPNSLFEHS